eukprot:6990572-Pyramimonas_sp.AAC.1
MLQPRASCVEAKCKRSPKSKKCAQPLPFVPAVQVMRVISFQGSKGGHYSMPVIIRLKNDNPSDPIEAAIDQVAE